MKIFVHNEDQNDPRKVAFYTDLVNGDAMPADAIEITPEEHLEYLNAQHAWKFVDGALVDYDMPEELRGGKRIPMLHEIVRSGFATGAQIYDVLDADETKRLDAAVEAMPMKIRAYWLSHYTMPIPRDNPKLSRIAQKANVDLDRVFAAVADEENSEE